MMCTGVLGPKREDIQLINSLQVPGLDLSCPVKSIPNESSANLGTIMDRLETIASPNNRDL